MLFGGMLVKFNYHTHHRQVPILLTQQVDFSCGIYNCALIRNAVVIILLQFTNYF